MSANIANMMWSH